MHHQNLESRLIVIAKIVDVSCHVYSVYND